MGFRLHVAGSESIEILEKLIETVEFSVDTPNDSNARSTDVGSSIIVTGRILALVGSENEQDETIKLTNWSLVRSESADSYRALQLDVVVSSKIVRTVIYPKAFVVEYTEEFDEESGTGTFRLHAKQKKDAISNVIIQGDYA